MKPWTLEEFGLDLSPDPEDVDLDQEPWAPCRPTYGVLSGSYTWDGIDIDAQLQWHAENVWDGLEDDDRNAVGGPVPEARHKERKRVRRAKRTGKPDGRSAVLHHECGQYVLRRWYTDHLKTCYETDHASPTGPTTPYEGAHRHA